MPNILALLRRLPPFATSTLIVTLLVSWFVFSHQIVDKQETKVTTRSVVPTGKAVNKELLPRSYTAPITSAMVPLNPKEQKFYLYVSPDTVSYYAREGINYESILQHWRSVLKKEGIKPSVVSNFSAVHKGTGSVVILASAVALSDIEKRQLRDFQDRGGGILATWALASRNRSGIFQGYEYLESLFGIKIVGEIGKDSPLRFLNIAGDTPITLGYPSGQRVWLDKLSEKWLGIDGGNEAALYSDWTRNIHPEHAAAGVAYGTTGKENDARWVMLGFPETSWGVQADRLHGLLESSLQWLAHGVAAGKPSWPIPYDSAYVVEMDTEEGFENAPRLARMMDDIDAPATFYCVTSEALRHPEMVRALNVRHEIGFHGDVHNSFLYDLRGVQSARLDQMQQAMSKILGQPVPLPGFRAPKEEYDQNTEKLLAEKGFGHHVVDPNRTDARVPFLYQVAVAENNGSDLVILPRTQRDDFNLSIDSTSKDEEKRLLDALITDFEASLQMRAMGLLSVHTQHFGMQSALADVMPAFLHHMSQKRDRVWITTGGKIAEWWRDRERLEYRIDGNSERFTLNVNIPDKARFTRGALIITNAWAGSAPTVRPLEPSSSAIKLKPMDDLRTAVILDDLPAGAHSFEVVSESRAAAN
jgi:peptidoglycan/xylan/chitin deacetylase (PgdA/CDA1 family)